MRIWGLLTAGLMLPAGAWADSICPAYKFSCSEKEDSFSVKIVYLDECYYYSQPFFKDNERKVNELAKKHIYPLVPNNKLPNQTCTLEGHKLEVQARVTDNYSERPSYCGGEGPSLAITVKKDGKKVIDSVEFVNGCRQEYQVREMRYIAINRFIKNSGATLVFQASRSNPIFIENGTDINVNMEARVKVKDIPDGIFTQERLQNALSKVTDKLIEKNY